MPSKKSPEPEASEPEAPEPVAPAPEPAPEPEVPPVPPVVYQCQDPADPSFGSVAVKSGLSQYAYGIFVPNVSAAVPAGGRWEADGETVEKWTILQTKPE